MVAIESAEETVSESVWVKAAAEKIDSVIEVESVIVRPNSEPVELRESLKEVESEIVRVNLVFEGMTESLIEIESESVREIWVFNEAESPTEDVSERVLA